MDFCGIKRHKVRKAHCHAPRFTAPAVEYQKEGQVFGIGCKIFTIAGPVILYGIFSSWGLGLILWVLQMFGIRVG